MKNRRSVLPKFRPLHVLLLAILVANAACAPQSNQLRNMAGKMLSPEYYKDFENFENDDGTFEDGDEMTVPYDPTATDPDKSKGPDAAGPATPKNPTSPSANEPPDLPNAPSGKQNPTTPHPRPGHPTKHGAAGNCMTTDKLCFPVAGKVWFHDDFGAGRSGGRRHAGNDLFTKKLTPVVAIADGVIDVVKEKSPLGGNYIGINHGNGMRSLYMHLNNDSPGTNDGLGHGFMPGIKRGVYVKKGQQIGWTGNSGNAEHTDPHLHFEIRKSINPGAVRVSEFFPINPYKILREIEPAKSVLPMAANYERVTST